MGKRGTLNRLSRHRVAATMAASRSLSEAARALNVRQSTVSRWVSSRKVLTPGQRRLAAAPLAALSHQEGDGAPLAPAQWAAELRRLYSFSLAESQLLRLAEVALALALNPERDDVLRLTAARQFGQLLRQLRIPEDDHGDETPANAIPGA